MIKYVEKTCVGLWSQLTILKVVCDVITGIREGLSQYNVIKGRTKRKLVSM